MSRRFRRIDVRSFVLACRTSGINIEETLIVVRREWANQMMEDARAIRDGLPLTTESPDAEDSST